MRYLMILMSITMISCGKNASNFMPISDVLIESSREEVSNEPAFKAQMSLVSTVGGVIKTGNIELSAIALEDVQTIREGKETSHSTHADTFALYAADLSQRLELLEKLGTSDLTQAQIVIKLNRELKGRWGWIDSRGAETWNDKLKKDKDENFIITLNDKRLIAAILEHNFLPTIMFENYSAKMSRDEFSSFKVQKIKAEKANEFDFVTTIDKDSIIKAQAYAVKYQVQSYTKGLRYKHCEWYDNGDVGGRRTKRLVCSEERCEVNMHRVVEVSREERELEDVMSFDQETKIEDDWFYAHAGDSLRMKSDFASEIVNVGMVGQGSCAGKEMLEVFPGTSSQNIAPRNIVRLTTYLVL